MSFLSTLGRSAANLFVGFVVACQFLTRLPMPRVIFAPDSLARAAAFFPVVGMALGAGAALLHKLLAPHFNRTLSALGIVIALVLVTGGLHEDGLADTADGFGGGRDREHILLILRDSRIGSYGALALILSTLARLLLIASVPLEHVPAYLVTSQTLCRWSPLPLSLLPAARVPGSEAGSETGQGARLAQRASRRVLLTGSLLAGLIGFAALRSRVIAPILLTIAIVALSARYFLRKIGGVTGDCFGATIQLTEIAVLCCGAWVA